MPEQTWNMFFFCTLYNKEVWFDVERCPTKNGEQRLYFQGHFLENEREDKEQNLQTPQVFQALFHQNLNLVVWLKLTCVCLNGNVLFWLSFPLLKRYFPVFLYTSVFGSKHRGSFKLVCVLNQSHECYARSNQLGWVYSISFVILLNWCDWNTLKGAQNFSESEKEPLVHSNAMIIYANIHYAMDVAHLPCYTLSLKISQQKSFASKSFHWRHLFICYIFQW